MASLTMLAQTTGGSLTGRVTDSAGAPAGGIEISARNEATNRPYKTISSKEGIYVFPDLDPGRYTVTAQQTVVGGVAVEVATRYVLNLTLQAASTGEKGVQAPNNLLEAGSSEVGTYVSPKFLQDAPLFVKDRYRNPETFVQYLPGVNNGPTESSIVGGPTRSKEILLGGASLANPDTGGILSAPPSVEQINELRLLTATLPAQYGRTSSGLEVFTTRSGSNRLHGSLFDYFRHEKLDAAGWAVNSTGRPKNKLRQNEYGVAIGGPLSIPEVYDGRNRSFFYFTYNQFKQKSQNTTSLITLPTLPMRAGDFGNLVDSSGRKVLIYDPATTRDQGAGLIRDVFTDNKIPANRFSAVSKKILNFIPEPDNNRLTNNFLAQNKVKQSLFMWSLKLDQMLSMTSRVSIFANLQKDDSLNEGPLPDELSNGNQNYSRPQFYRVIHEKAGPDRANQLRIAYTRYYTHWDRIQAQRVDWSERLGLAGIDNGGSSSFPVVNFTNGLAPFGRYTDLRTRGGQMDKTYELSDDMSRIRGRHEMKLGFDIRLGRSYHKPLQDTGVQGQFNFSNAQTALPQARATTGHSFASFMLGLPDSGLRYLTSQAPDMRYAYTALYLQDNFKFSSKLTLNVGLRYDLPFSRYDNNDTLSSFDPNLANPAAGGIKGALAVGGKGTGHNGRKRFGDVDKTEFGPRFGFAYALNSRTVARGGWGMLYSAGNGLSGNACTLCFIGATALIQQVSNGLDPAFRWDNGLTPQQGFRRPPSVDPSFANGSSIFFLSRDEGKAPRFQNWSFNIQHEMPWRFLLDLGYVGTKGTRLGGALPLNQVDPKYLSLGNLLSLPINDARVGAAGFRRPYADFNGTLAQSLRPFPQFLDITDHYGAKFESRYDALQLKVVKRYSDFNLLLNYTYSKATSNGASSQAATDILAPQNAYNLSAEDSFQLYDIPHAFNIIYTWDLPIGRGKRMLNSSSKLITMLASGWTLAGEHQYRSGNLLLVNAPNTLGSGAVFAARQRPNATGSGFRTGTSASDLDPGNPTSRWLNRAAYSIPAPFTFGNGANFYDDVRNPGIRSENFSIVKRTPVTESVNVEYRVDMNNVFNRAVFGNINTNLTDPNFGRPTGVMIDPRAIQMALKFNF